MPELRKDPVVGRWVIIATERARRPGNFVDPKKTNFPEKVEECPFCDNKEKEIYAVKGRGRGKWKVRVVPNGTPVLQTNVESKRHGRGLYYAVNGYGVQDVIIETPDHIANIADLDQEQITRVIHTYIERMAALEKMPNLQYAMIFKNYGWAAGSRNIAHARSQIIASAVNPLRVKEKLTGAKKYFDYHERCVYCDLIEQELADRKRLVAENEDFLAVTPFAPRFLFETWILPKEHHCDFYIGAKGKEESLAAILQEVLLRLKIGVDDPVYNYVVQTAPFHREERWDRWRTIQDDYHWHLEIMPRLARAAGFEKGSGFYICPVPPEDVAEFLRKVEMKPSIFPAAGAAA